jgi:hypothetical protein
MSVSGELLCSFELLKPLDSSALKHHIKKGKTKRQTMLNSPVSLRAWIGYAYPADAAYSQQLNTPKVFQARIHLHSIATCVFRFGRSARLMALAKVSTIPSAAARVPLARAFFRSFVVLMRMIDEKQVENLII